MIEKKYCQYCGAKLTKKLHERKKRLYCNICDLYCWENPLPGSVAVVFNEDKTKVLLIKRGVEPQKGKWALPGGFVDRNESPQAAALRELREETGLIGSHTHLIDVVLQHSRLFGGVIVIGFLIEGVEGELIPGDDALDAAFFDLSKLPDIAFDCHKYFIEKVRK